MPDTLAPRLRLVATCAEATHLTFVHTALRDSRHADLRDLIECPVRTGSAAWWWVSADIEEAWSVHVQSVHQIIYYGDFLGRSPLEPRLGRNEDDRLVQFMRLAGRSATTKFMLTTREYILRHAHQLYERLADGDLGGRKILLELPAYTRRQRAEISTATPTLKAR
jgi:hypothetical protein